MVVGVRTDKSLGALSGFLRKFLPGKRIAESGSMNLLSNVKSFCKTALQKDVSIYTPTSNIKKMPASLPSLPVPLAKTKYLVLI